MMSSVGWESTGASERESDFSRRKVMRRRVGVDTGGWMIAGLDFP